MKMNIFKKKTDYITNLIYLISGLMFVVSAIFTIALYTQDGTNLINSSIMGLMGLCIELSKVFFLILLAFFIYKRQVLFVSITAILTVILLCLSMYANYNYTKNIDSKKLEQTKTISEKYKTIESNLKTEKSNLKELKNEKKNLTEKINSIDTEISNQRELKNNELSNYTSVWSKESISKQYNSEINTLNSNRKQVTSNLESINSKISKSENKIDNLTKSLQTTSKYKYIKNQGLSNNLIRIILGIIFEIIAVFIFFVGEVRKIILKRESDNENNIETIFNNAINDLIISTTKNFSEMIREQKLNVLSSTNDMKETKLIENKLLEDKLLDNEEIENSKSRKKVIDIENIKMFYEYLIKNNKNGKVTGYKKVGEKLGLTQGESTRIYKKLLEKGYLNKENKSTFLMKYDFNENDFLMGSDEIV